MQRQTNFRQVINADERG